MKLFIKSFWIFLFSLPLFCSDAWMDRIVDREFARFQRRGITKQQIEATWKRCKKNQLFARYRIIDSKVYGKESKIKHLLEELVATFPVPDVDFIYFNEDRLRTSFFRNKKFFNCAPIFVSAKDRSIDRAILFCDWCYDIRSEQDEWNSFRCLIESDHRTWSEKIPKLFWRGSSYDGFYTLHNWSTHPRGKVVWFAKHHPELIDAAFTNYPYWCTENSEEFEKIVGKSDKCPLMDHLQYKYQLIVDGITTPFSGSYWRLYSGCLSFKQESNNIMFFSEELIPWKHYIPIRADCSDLIEKIRWAQTHDEEAKKIAEQARLFAETHCFPQAILLYCFKVLKRYASLQKFQPTLE